MIRLNSKKIIKEASLFSFEHWDDEDYTITFAGEPIGKTVRKKEAEIIVKWLNTANLKK